MTMTQWTVHPAADLFPLIEGDEFEALKRDIGANGQQVPIAIYCGEVLDGRNRMRACVELGIEPIVEVIPSTCDPWAIVVSRNLYRRHLLPHQRGAIFKAILEQRGARVGSQGRQKAKTATIADIASDVGVSERTMRHNIAAAEAYEALSEPTRKAVDKGEVSLKAATREANPPKPASSPRKADPVVIDTLPDEVAQWGDDDDIDETESAEPFADEPEAIGALMRALSAIRDKWPDGKLASMRIHLNLFAEGLTRE